MFRKCLILVILMVLVMPHNVGAAPSPKPQVTVYYDASSQCTFTVGSPQYRSDYNRLYYTGTMTCNGNQSYRTLEVRLRRDFSWSPDQTRASCTNSGVYTFFRCSSSKSCGTSAQTEHYFTEATDMQTGRSYQSSRSTVNRLC